jgi:sugar lactone lactonase YvrE
MRWRTALWLGAGVGAAALAVIAARALDGKSVRRGRPGRSPYRSAGAPPLELVHEFHGPIPTGVTVSRSGRIFVCHPRWEDEVAHTVTELRDGVEVPFPSAAANDPGTPDGLFSVQSVIVDPRDRLWALDTGSVDMAPHRGLDWVKLVAIDLATGELVKTIRFPEEVVHPKTYLNDVRFDLRRGAEGMAFITDSAVGGPNGIIVVDLATGRSWRKLHGHPSTGGDRTFFAMLEGRPLLVRRPGSLPRVALVGADGIAIGAGGERLWFTPLASRRLVSVSLDALADERLPDEDVAATLREERRRFASDGLEADERGRLYLTDWEHNALHVREPGGEYRTLAHDPRLWWPDTLALSRDGWLYVTANQLQRLPKFHGGEDRRVLPMHLFRVHVGAGPVLLDR